METEEKDRREGHVQTQARLGVLPYRNTKPPETAVGQGREQAPLHALISDSGLQNLF